MYVYTLLLDNLSRSSSTVYTASVISYLSFIQQHIRYNVRQTSRKNQHNVLVGIGKLANLQHNRHYSEQNKYR